MTRERKKYKMGDGESDDAATGQWVVKQRNTGQWATTVGRPVQRSMLSRGKKDERSGDKEEYDGQEWSTCPDAGLGVHRNIC